MIEKSPWEGSMDDRLSGSTCLAKITSVDTDRRMCRVKTLGRKGVNNDLDETEVPFLLNASHKEGDEDTFVPRIGSMGVVQYVNSQPFIIGYYQQVPQEGSSIDPGKEPLQPGDRIIKTKAGNKTIWRSGGTVEIEANRHCYTVWNQSRNRMTSNCQNYELETNGGFMHWIEEESDSADDRSTRLLFRCFDYSGGADNVVEISVGTNLDVAEDELLSINLGPASDNTIASKTFSLQVLADGNTKVVVNNKCTLTIDPSGNVNLATDGSVNASVKGSTNVTTSGSLNFTTKGSTTVKSEGAIQLETAASMTLKAPGNPVPGNLVTDNMQNIDPITGVPLLGHTQIQVP